MAANGSQMMAEEHQLQVLMARQPVYTKSQDVVAFELLFRDNEGRFVEGLKDDEATLGVLLGTYSSITKKGVVKSLPCFLKVTDSFLLNNDLPELPKQSFVLELLGHSNITPELIARVKDLARQGYRLALADYDPRNPKFEPLLNIVHVLKLDIQLLGLENIPPLLQKLRPYQLELLADKVETQEEFRLCLEMGFALYMGYFLSKPEAVKGKKITGNKVVLLQILTELQRPNATAQSIEQIALQDPALTFRILKVVNSAAFNLKREISSLAHAITLLGIDQIKRWVLLFLSAADKNKPDELTRNMLTRGRMCELLAEMMGRDEPINHFIVGLLSQLDVLLDMEMVDLLDQVPLQQDMKEALLDRAHSFGELLRQVEIYERGDFDQLSRALDRPFYEVAYRHSLNWAQQVLQAMQEG
ncbi:EAL and HDOD domain-containing protein [Marinobacterium sediminicola]|uniref:EAL and modified HD-GYP domain-containing signal transduction protein n=1 Tax=Marinobacterium sediminicola TaxID=518898 RepID=A0ABY1S3H7_9GAMM|nr:HDOD domain-containing protein [Marinobacterium sediminicola]ULG69304.1 HDOD domain-containing protein [Marinobacterium sediminicola]SMR77655.1 EAL and modified HD-GYP domain-containing signal transduction protein [Marinobacterium sediminicola]